jgi:PIN domain nuclease of toxin-antitoxin system
MMEYVADTHAVVWHYFVPHLVGKAARRALLDADAGSAKIYLPAVAIAEMIMIIEKQRIAGVTMAMLVSQFQAMRNSGCYEFLPLFPDLVISSRALTAVHEIFDRLIVADALRLNLPLITRDSDIRSSKLVNTIWD